MLGQAQSLLGIKADQMAWFPSSKAAEESCLRPRASAWEGLLTSGTHKGKGFTRVSESGVVSGLKRAGVGSRMRRLSSVLLTHFHSALWC